MCVQIVCWVFCWFLVVDFCVFGFWFFYFCLFVCLFWRVLFFVVFLCGVFFFVLFFFLGGGVFVFLGFGGVGVRVSTAVGIYGSITTCQRLFSKPKPITCKLSSYECPNSMTSHTLSYNTLLQRCVTCANHGNSQYWF